MFISTLKCTYDINNCTILQFNHDCHIKIGLPHRGEIYPLVSNFYKEYFVAIKLDVLDILEKTLILYPFSEVLLQNGAAHPTILYE